jgi:hypothetical protein
MESEQITVARRRISKHVPAAATTHITEELLGLEFSMQYLYVRYSVCSKMNMGK